MPIHWKDKLIEDDPTMFTEPDDYEGPSASIFFWLLFTTVLVGLVGFGLKHIYGWITS